MHLHDIRIFLKNLAHTGFNPGSLFISDIHGINGNAGQNDMVLLEYILGYFSFNIVELTDGHGVRDFDVYGSNLSIWSIVVDDKIIGATYALCLTDGISDGLRDFRVNPFSENLAYGIAQHIDTGFDDHSGDKGAEPCLQADVEQEIDGGSGQGGGGDDGVIERIASGGYQG